MKKPRQDHERFELVEETTLEYDDKPIEIIQSMKINKRV
jgi:hypothetical protein